MKRSRDDLLSSGQAHMSTASSAQGLTTTDALSYLKAVKEMFKDRKEMYDDFLEVMKDFKSQRIDTSGVTQRVKELFKGNRDLILGFNNFLPKGYEITEDEPVKKKKPVEFEEAMGFVTKIKTRFQGDDHVYKDFLEILNMYKKDSKPITEVYHEVSILFQDHYDLLVEFTHFLPDTSGAATIHHPQPGRNHIIPGADKIHSTTITRPIQVEKKPAVFHALGGQLKGNTEEKEKNEWEHVDTLDHKKKLVHRDGLVTDQFQREAQGPELTFREKVKEGLHDPESYGKFLDCIRSYKSKFVPTSQFRKLVGSLIGRQPDLMVACEDFITYIEKTGVWRNNRQVFRSSKVEGDEEDNDKEYRYENSDQDNKHDTGLAFSAKDLQGHKMPYAGREKFVAKCIQDLDLSNCESCTPSYRLLPDNYPIPSASYRTDIGNEVLNDHWVSVTSGSEDYSFKHMRKNQYEESLFRCEDDRFELDMLLESVNATAKCVEEIVDRMNISNKTDSPFFIEDHLTALNLRCIERLYGDHGLDVIDVLRKNASLALPVILTRLNQKQEEWARCRADFNKVWAEIYAKNYHKSLDHRSFYFKQQDTKNLSAKALLAEIKDIGDKNQNEDETALLIGAGLKQPIRPQMEFEYPDPDIQDDLYELIKYSCGEICTPEQRDKVMKLWTTFLEPVIGVPPRPATADDRDSIDTSKKDVAQSMCCVGQENDIPADEASLRRTSDVSRTGDNQVPTDHSSPCKLHMVYGSDVLNGDGSPGTVNIASKSDLLCNAHSIGDANRMPSRSWRGGQVDFLEEGTASTAGEESIIGEGASAAQRGSGGADFQMEAMTTKTSQDSVSTRPTSSLIDVLPVEIKVQKSLQENEAPCTSGRGEVESSLNKNLEVSNAVAAGNTFNGVEQSPCKSAPSFGGIGGEETDAVADDEVEESAQGSSGSENASENGDASVSESANGEEHSPDDHGDGGNHEENDTKAESEAEADSTADAHDTEGTMPLSDRFLQTLKPLVLEVPKALRGKEKNSQIFYGNDSFYLLFRLHQMLYERMQRAKLHSSSPENKWRNLNGAYSEDPYARFKDALHSLLNGSSDSAKFEDECRAIIGAQSYVLFTLDKLIHKLVKQVQTIATEEIDSKLLQLYAYERSRSPETFADTIYHENARFLIPEDNLYRIECFPHPVRLSIQLMNNDNDKIEPTAVSMDPAFASYLHDELLSVIPDRTEKPRMFLERNIRKLYSGDDTCNASKAMEGLVVRNGVEMKFNCNTLKASYVLDTEDILYRTRERRWVLYKSRSFSSNRATNGTTNGSLHKARRRSWHFYCQQTSH